MIRPMTLSDLKAVLAIEAASYTHPWPERMFRDELSGPDRSYLVALDGLQIAGYGGLATAGGEAHITTLTVAPARRQAGLGTELMLALVDAALEAGSEHLRLEVRPSNEAARRLYERFGLAPVGVSKGYYRDEDALIMWAHDVDGAGYRARLDRIREMSA